MIYCVCSECKNYNCVRNICNFKGGNFISVGNLKGTKGCVLKEEKNDELEKDRKSKRTGTLYAVK